MPTASTSFRTEKENLSVLDDIAKEMGRSRNWVLNKAVEDFISYQTWFKQQVEIGIEAADNGEFATSEEIDEVFASFGAK